MASLIFKHLTITANMCSTAYAPPVILSFLVLPAHLTKPYPAGVECPHMAFWRATISIHLRMVWWVVVQMFCNGRYRLNSVGFKVEENLSKDGGGDQFNFTLISISWVGLN